MARDLIGPALPPGFKAVGAAGDEERDPSPGKLRRPSGLGASQAWRAGEWGVGDPS